MSAGLFYIFLAMGQNQSPDLCSCKWNNVWLYILFVNEETLSLYMFTEQEKLCLQPCLIFRAAALWAWALLHCSPFTSAAPPAQPPPEPTQGSELNHTEMILHRHQFKSDSCKWMKDTWTMKSKDGDKEKWCVERTSVNKQVSTVQFITLFIKISELVKYTTLSSLSVLLETNRRNRSINSPSSVNVFVRVHTAMFAAALQAVATHRLCLVLLWLLTASARTEASVHVCGTLMSWLHLCVFTCLCVLVRPIKHAALVSDTLAVNQLHRSKIRLSQAATELQ